MPQTSDQELIEEFKRGDSKGFNELVRRYQQKVYWIAQRTIGNHEDADDITQEVFVRVHRALKNFRAESGFYTWLYRITMNVSLNALRKKRIKQFVRFEEVEGELEDLDHHTDRDLLRDEYTRILRRAIDRLPPKQKMVFQMRYYDELSYETMATILKRSVGGIKANYFFAVKKIQEFVRKESAL